MLRFLHHPFIMVASLYASRPRLCNTHRLDADLHRADRASFMPEMCVEPAIQKGACLIASASSDCGKAASPNE